MILSCSVIAWRRHLADQRREDIEFLSTQNIVCSSEGHEAYCANWPAPEQQDGTFARLGELLGTDVRAVLQVGFHGTPEHPKAAADALNRIPEYRSVVALPDSEELVRHLKPNPNVTFVYEALATERNVQNAIRLFPNTEVLMKRDQRGQASLIPLRRTRNLSSLVPTLAIDLAPHSHPRPRHHRIGSCMFPLIPYRDPQLLTALTVRAGRDTFLFRSPCNRPIVTIGPHPGSPFDQHQLAWHLGDAVH
ncbi:MAG: hypothetical protein IH991_06740 [Planctomycetes bacterium]|nr:hypothetical protein [Planctomycetota bacterium]